MRHFLQVFRFEFFNYAKNKVFIAITLILVAAAGVVLFFPQIQSVFSAEESTPPAQEQPADEPIGGVVAVSGLTAEEMAGLAAALPDNRLQLSEENADQLQAEVANGTYEAAIVVTGELSYTYIAETLGMYDMTTAIVDEYLLNRYRATQLTSLGASSDTIETVLGAQVESTILQTENGTDQMQSFFYTYILLLALYMAILLYGQFVATSVATEKSSRAMELLITSTKPKYLMFGKILGTGSAGLLQFILIFGSCFVFYNLNKDSWQENEIIQSIFNIPTDILLYAILFFILGYFLYAFMYGALGSVVSKLEQLNVAVLPVTFLFVIAFTVVVASLSSGDTENLLIQICSFVPFTSPMAMFVRIAMGSVPVWQILLSVGILVLSTIAVGFAAAAIYRAGVLMYGKPPKLRELVAVLREKA